MSKLVLTDDDVSTITNALSHIAEACKRDLEAWEDAILLATLDRVSHEERIVIDLPPLRRRLMVGVIVATQAREGITTTQAQAEAAYDKVRREKSRRR